MLKMVPVPMLRNIDSPADMLGYKFLLIVFSQGSYYQESDARAIATNGAHGYPGGTTYYNRFEMYGANDPKDFEWKLARLFEDKEKFQIIEVARLLEVKQKVVIE